MGFLKHNWQIKLVSLVISTILFIYVRQQANIRHQPFVVPVSVALPSGAAGQKVVLDPPDARIRVDVEGPEGDVLSIDPADIKLSVDTSGLQAGKTVQLPVSVEIPPRVRERVQVSWHPLSVKAKLVPEATRELPVQVKALNQPDGWALSENLAISPARATVTGPQAAVNSVQSIIAPVTLPETPRLSLLPMLQAVDAEGKPVDQVRVDPAQALVTGMQQPVVLQKRVPVQPQVRIPNNAHVSIDVNPSRVRVTGPEREVTHLFMVETDPVEIPPGQTQVSKTVAVRQPPGKVDVTPSQVTVTVRLQRGR